MSREMLSGTCEAALGLAETYEELLKQRARRLTGEDSNRPTSPMNVMFNLMLAGTLAPSPHIIDWVPQPTTYGPELTQTLGEGAANRAMLIKEVAESLEASQNRSKQPLVKQ